MKLFCFHRLLLTIIGFSLHSILTIHLQAQCMLEPVSLTVRAEKADMIVEGRVVAQKSFWNTDSSGIFTSQVIRIYKILKGQSGYREIELITAGGRVGTDMELVEPSLQLQLQEVGVFFLKSEQRIKDRPFQTRTRPVFQAFASVQGFIEYDETTGYAHDVFERYDDVKQGIYEPLARYSKQKSIELVSYQLTHPQRTQSRSTPNISSFSPRSLSAGTQSILSIKGQNFGVQGSNSRVFFANPDNGGGSFIAVPEVDIVSWSDREIQVKVPTSAGTGRVKVSNDTGNEAISSSNLTIIYAQYTVLHNGASRPVLLADRNGQGGYTVQYGINTAHNGIDFTTRAKQPFERALNAWQCKTGFNISVGNTTTENNPSGSNTPNIVMFDNDKNSLPFGVLGRTYSGLTTCTGDYWYLKGFDIVYSRNIPWHYDTSDPCVVCFDFESVTLHELGHGHLMAHVINREQVMHYAISVNTQKRELDQISAIAGGQAILSASNKVDICYTYIPGMDVKYQNCEEATPYLQAKLLLEGYWLPGTDVMHTYLKDQNLLPKQQPFHGAPYYYQGLESVENFPENITDWILLELRDKNDQTTVMGRQACLLKKDGTIVNINGQTSIYLPGVVNGEYYLAVFHPRHLGVISGSPINYVHHPTTYDFTISQAQAQGNGQLKLVGNKYALLGGDYDGNGSIDIKDFNLWQVKNTQLGQYLSIDGDGSGDINVHDFNIWMRNRNTDGSSAIQIP